MALETRIVSVHLPWWSTERVQRLITRQQLAACPPGITQPYRPSSEPVLLITTAHGIERITRCCPRATRAGVRPGITLAHAQSLLGNPRTLIRTHAPSREATALDRLARNATRFSPTVTPDWPDGLLLDITGCQALFKGEHRLLNQLSQWLTKQGFTNKLGIAPTVGAAWALARHATRPKRHTLKQWPSTDPATLKEVLAPLPVAALRLTSDSLQKLHLVGVRHVHELFAMDKASLLERLGADELLKINQALGLEPELLVPHRPSDPILFEQLFDGPCPQIQAVEAALSLLIQKSCTWLLTREAGLTRLRITVQCSDLPQLMREASFSRPTRDPKHIGSVLRPFIEKVHLGWGALAVHLEVLSHQQITHRQAEAWDACFNPGHESHAMSESLGTLMDQWTGRLSADRILRPTLSASHTPQRKSKLTSAQTRQKHHSLKADATTAQTTLTLPWLLLDPPEQILVDLSADDESAPPTRLLWRSQWHTIIDHTGPQRVTDEWWRTHIQQNTPARDYHRLQILDHASGGGRWLWVYEDLASSRWFIHGIWA